MKKCHFSSLRQGVIFIEALVFILCDLEKNVLKISKKLPDFLDKIRTKP